MVLNSELQVILLLTWTSIELISAGTSGNFPYPSCKAIALASPAAMSGEYSIRTVTGKVLNKVFCEMGLDGGGYTYIHSYDLPYLTNAELQAMFTDKTRFLLRARLANGSQPYGVLKQLPQYSNVGYPTPLNVATLGPLYLFYGFLPATLAANVGTVQGLQVNGVSITFNNCDGNPNSYFATFPDSRESIPTGYGYGSTFPMYNQILTSLRPNPSRRVMPDDYFTFFESHFGGCGLYTQSDGRQEQIGSSGQPFSVISIAIAFQ